MKHIAPAIILGLYLSTPALALSGGLYVKKSNGQIVYTNIGTASFFRRAFKIGGQEHYSKAKVMSLIKKTAEKLGVDPKLAIAIAKIESDFNNNSVSKSGAKGVMQLIDKTAAYYGVRNINNLEENISGGIKFLKHLTSKYKDLKLVAAAYNAGETAVDKYKGVPPFKETQRYVTKFMSAYYGKNIKYKTVRRIKIIRSRPVKKIGNIYSNIPGSIW